jgi:CO/xanthine dehydrogenase FAD-binding subunit
VRRFDLVLPESVEECLGVLAERGPEAKLVAGGTDLVPQLRNDLLRPVWVVDLSGIVALRRLHWRDGGGLAIGPAVTARALERDARVRARFPALAESAALIGSIQVRGLATIGGNLCNAAPSADMAPPLLALDAEAVLAGPRGARRVPLVEFFAGVRHTVLAPDELLVDLVLPDPGPRSGGSYLRHTPRRELDIAVVGVASQLTLSDGVCARARIALAAVAPTPLRATAAEQVLVGEPVTAAAIDRAAALAVEASRPITDQRGSAEFRRHLVEVLTRRTLATALARAAADRPEGP